MKSFDFQCPTQIVFGPGKVNELGSLAAGVGGKRVLAVTDPGIIAAGHAPRAIRLLEQAGIEVAMFDGVEENPTTDHVEAGLDVARRFQPELLVAIGGGSSMDCAKGINFLYSCGGRMQDYWGEGKATGPMQPMIAVPTTAGTGSEAQSFALVADAKTHVKMACGDKRATFRAAILDPELTLTQPPRVTALTAIDALSHALESYVTKRRNDLSAAFSRESWRYLAPNISRVLDQPNDLEVRGAMQLGACLGGLAIENSMLGAAHALANPLTAAYGTAHGEAVALMLPHVIRHNGRHVEVSYSELVTDVDGAIFRDSSNSATDSLALFVEQIRSQAGLAATLKKCGVSRERLPELAAAASQQWTGKFNPIELSTNDYFNLYEAAY
jgi:alcohol dehydrogenase